MKKSLLEAHNKIQLLTGVNTVCIFKLRYMFLDPFAFRLLYRLMFLSGIIQISL
jgi:hypothetical protein